MVSAFDPSKVKLTLKSADKSGKKDTGVAQPRILFDGCPLCTSRNCGVLRTADCSRHPLYRTIIPSTMTWLRCNDCSHVFTDGYFSPEAAAVIFEKTLSSQKPGSAFEQQRVVSARIVASVAQYAKAGPWLDVGIGNGSLLFTAEEWGYTPVGIDLRRSTVEAMRNLGFESHCLDVAELKEDNRFSVISMADVLEHMPIPGKGIAAARRLLQPDGILFVSMPNYDCPAWRLLDAKNANPYWAEIEHFHNFSRTRLYRLMQENGFEPLQYGISERYRVCMEVILRRTH